MNEINNGGMRNTNSRGMREKRAERDWGTQTKEAGENYTPIATYCQTTEAWDIQTEEKWEREKVKAWERYKSLEKAGFCRGLRKPEAEEDEQSSQTISSEYQVGEKLGLSDTYTVYLSEDQWYNFFLHRLARTKLSVSSLWYWKSTC